MLSDIRLFFSLIFILLISACSSPQESLLRVGTNQWTGYETLYLARDLDFFNSKYIKLKELPSSTEVIRAFKQGRLDVAALTLDEVLLLAQTEQDLRIFLVMDISNGADKVIVGKDILQLSELKNKTIAMEGSALGAYMLYHLLKAAKLDLSDVKVNSATVDQHLELMINGKSDAVITFDPTASSLTRLGYRELFNSSQIPNKIVDVLVTKQSVIEQQGDNLAALISGQWRALDYLQSNPSDAYRRIVPRLAISVSELDGSYKTLKLPAQLQNQQLFAKNNPVGLHTTLQELAIVLHKVKLIQDIPALDSILTDELI